LAFERLYVAALVREIDDAKALVRVPGTDRARRALRAKEPLTRTNFLKGQAVNGPTGVMARLARHVGIAEDDRPGPRAVDLLCAWSEDEKLPGVIEDGGRDGARLMTQFADSAADVVAGRWPGSQSGIWGALSEHLRPDHIGEKERKEVVSRLDAPDGGVRKRVLELLVKSSSIWRRAGSSDRGLERMVLLDGVRGELGDATEDRAIGAVLGGIDVYERASSSFLAAFDAIRWVLSGPGSLSVDHVLGDRAVRERLDAERSAMTRLLKETDRALSAMSEEPSLQAATLAPLHAFRDDLEKSTSSNKALLDTVLSRHERVQREKEKGLWIDRQDRLILMPGFALTYDAPPDYTNLYLHPFRVVNAYTMLQDLGVVRGPDVEAEN
jgi:hypothetical protein